LISATCVAGVDHTVPKWHRRWFNHASVTRSSADRTAGRAPPDALARPRPL